MITHTLTVSVFGREVSHIVRACSAATGSTSCLITSQPNAHIRANRFHIPPQAAVLVAFSRGTCIYIACVRCVFASARCGAGGKLTGRYVPAMFANYSGADHGCNNSGRPCQFHLLSAWDPAIRGCSLSRDTARVYQKCGTQGRGKVFHHACHTGNIRAEPRCQSRLLRYIFRHPIARHSIAYNPVTPFDLV